jgi:hypothetical protein
LGGVMGLFCLPTKASSVDSAQAAIKNLQLFIEEYNKDAFNNEYLLEFALLCVNTASKAYEKETKLVDYK